MDYILFTILTICSSAGFMASSCTTTGDESKKHKMQLEHLPYTRYLGYISQVVFIVLAFFVIPWWSVFLVPGLGFGLFMLIRGLCKKYFPALPLIILLNSIIIIPFLVLGKSSNPSENTDLTIKKFVESRGHFRKALHYAERSNSLLIEGLANGFLSPERINKISEYNTIALREAQKADPKVLDNIHINLSEHFLNEFMEGIEAINNGFKSDNQEEILQGQVLIERWDSWYSVNEEYFKDR